MRTGGNRQRFCSFQSKLLVETQSDGGMTRDCNVVIERDSEGYYVASVPSLPGCHTQAKSLDTLMERIREAIEPCLEVAQGKDERPDFVGVQKVSVAVGQSFPDSPERRSSGRYGRQASRKCV